jgi:Zn-dependent protease with chaperone function
MNFFEAQERARRSSRFLVLWFALCLIGVVVVMYFAIVGLSQLNSSNPSGVHYATETSQLVWWNGELFIGVSVLVGGVILIGSLVKLSQLSAGGKVVASSLGGRLVEPGTRDLRERRLLNVVEEMAIASGLPVPGVWVMDEERGINAFAAGTDPANAVIGVTRGTLERLTRSELQGVIAHEYSHILNGDMKLNIRLMGWIFGLVMLSMLGRVMMESIRFLRGSRDSKAGVIVLAILVGGVLLWLVGAIGIFFAKILQAAVSRQREYLADASAVQFTRDPNGIAGALKKIGGFSTHGAISSPKAMEVRHMFFAGSSLSSLMATHPPLDRRIKAIDSKWDGKLDEANIVPVDASEFPGAMGFAGAADEVASAQIGQLGDIEHMDAHVGGVILEGLQADQISIHSKHDAKCMLLGLLVAADENGLEKSREVLEEMEYEETTIVYVMEWSRHFSAHTSSKKLALVDLSIVWLRQMGREEATKFVETSRALIQVDGQIDLFEFMMQKVIERHVEIGLGLRPVPAMRFRKLVDLEYQVSKLLSAFVQLAGGDAALEKAGEEYRQHTGMEMKRLDVGIGEVAGALSDMDAATPLVKQQILRLCALVVTHDSIVEDAELQLLRATGEAIGAPIPPLARMVM